MVTTLPPTYPHLPEVTVRDFAVVRLGPKRAKFWRGARDAAVVEWNPTILNLSVVEARTTESYREGEVSLDIADVPPGIGGWADYGATPPPESDTFHGGWVWVDLQEWEKAWLARTKAHLRYIISHELGHTLSLNHGTGVMATVTSSPWPKVTMANLGEVNAYWT